MKVLKNNVLRRTFEPGGGELLVECSDRFTVRSFIIYNPPEILFFSFGSTAQFRPWPLP
jgi:hypothetical protein